jgi:Circadian oscillating protein COP23
MKVTFLHAVGVIALSLIASMPFTPSAQAEVQSNHRFFCGKSRNAATGGIIPTTIARTQRGNVLMIYWKSNFFTNSLSDYTPESRCIEVSRRFQTFYSKGNLTYLTTGKINDQNVICVAEEYGGPCKGLLLTLESKDNPQQVLRDLMDVRVNAKGPITRSAGSTYIDLEEFLEAAPIQDEALSASPTVQTSPQN